MSREESTELLQLLRDLEELRLEERTLIRQVVERDQQLRKEHAAQLGNLKAEIDKLQRVRETELDFELSKSCALCLAQLGHFFSSGSKCSRCLRIVCCKCKFLLNKPNLKWICVLCYKKRQLRLASGEWLECSFTPRSSVGAIVLKALHKLNHQYGQFLDPRSARGATISGHREPLRKARPSCESSPLLSTANLNPEFPRGSIRRKSAYEPASDTRSKQLRIDILESVHSPRLSSRFSASVHSMVDCLLHVPSDGVLLMSSGLKALVPGSRNPSLSLDEDKENRCDQITGKVIFGLEADDPAGEKENGDAVDAAFLENSADEVNTSDIIKRPADNRLTVGLSDPSKSFLQSRSYGEGEHVEILSLSSDMEDHHINPAKDIYGDIQVKVTFHHDDGCLEIFVLKARNLPFLSPTCSNAPNPYVKIFLCGEKRTPLKSRTSTQYGTFNPEYNHVARFKISVESVNKRYIRIIVCHKKMLGRKKILGETTMLVTETLLLSPHPIWVHLHQH